MRTIVWCSVSFLLFASFCAAQDKDVKVLLDSVAVQAEGIYEVDPDLATLEFNISAQEKLLKPAYEKATASLRRIIELAESNALRPEDINTGVFSVSPQWSKNKIRSYTVQSKVTLRIRDFSKIGPLLDDLVQAGVTEFRTMTYSVSDEEGARQKAVAEAMRRAVGRATAALDQNRQKLGAVRHLNLDVKQLIGITRWEADSIRGYALGAVAETVTVESGAETRRAESLPPPPPPCPNGQPENIPVRATVQCDFQIQ
jgi:uncharacterized protein YggE